VLAIPRGGVVIGFALARELNAELDIVLARKLRAPFQPEYALGAIAEDGRVTLNTTAAGLVDVEKAYLEEEKRYQLGEIARRKTLFREVRPAAPVAGRSVIVTDDGIATGSTMFAALRTVRAQNPHELIMAVPVAARDRLSPMRRMCDDVVCLLAPDDFSSVGVFYDDFTPVDDDEVVRLLREALPISTEPMPNANAGADSVRDVTIPVGGGAVAGTLQWAGKPRGVVVFAHGSGSSRHSPRNQLVARVLNGAGFATLLMDLLTPEEGEDRQKVFDISLLASRLTGAAEWLAGEPVTAGLPVGYFGASTGSAAALCAAAAHPDRVSAVVSRGGRPDLAGSGLSGVRAPTLLIVGGDDESVLTWNREALARLTCPKELAVVPGATHLFEEPGALAQVADLARKWFNSHLRRGSSTSPAPADARE
jgi:putative phosphoribosyl transferase